MKMFTEQYLNYRLAPMTINRRKKQTYPHSVCGTTYYSGSFDAECFMIADIIATIYIQSLYNRFDGYTNIEGYIDFRKNDKRLIEYMSQRSYETRAYTIDNWEGQFLKTNELTIPIPFKSLKKRFPFLKKYRSYDEMERLLRKVSSCKLGFNYYVRYLQSKDPVQYGIRYFDFSRHMMNLFDLDVDRKAYNTIFNLKFNSYFGFYFLQNITGAYVQQIDSRLYDCSNYAQLLYRYIIANIGGGEIILDRLKVKFGMVDYKNHSQTKKQFKGWLEELVGMNLIESFSMEEDRINVRPDIQNVRPDIENVRPDIFQNRRKVFSIKGL